LCKKFPFYSHGFYIPWAKKTEEILKKSTDHPERNIDQISIVNTYFHNHDKSSIDAGLREPLTDGSKQYAKMDVKYQLLGEKKRSSFSSIIWQLGWLKNYVGAVKKKNRHDIQKYVSKILILFSYTLTFTFTLF